jgi:hypothetical protein
MNPLECLFWLFATPATCVVLMLGPLIVVLLFAVLLSP